MLAVLPSRDGTVRLGEVDEPVVGPGEVLVAIAATALNRADLLQVRGIYPPPAGESEVPGLECAGTIVDCGREVRDWEPGQRVMALLAAGGHAERVAVPAGQLMPIPADWSFEQAAALPEAAITAWLNLAREGELAPGERALITAAASGVGAMAVQVARELGAGAIVVAGRDADRLRRLESLGATAVVPLGDGFAARVRDATGGRGVDLVFEMVGGDQLPQSLDALAERGRLVLIGLLAGPRATVDLSLVLRRRLRIAGSVLRPRSRAEKAAIVRDFTAFATPRWDRGALQPVIDRVVPFADVATAYATLARGGPLGKVVLRMASR